MRNTVILSLFLCLLTGFQIIDSQVISKPNTSIKSHETLDITSIEFVSGKTILNMMVENRIKGGSFCADRNIFITDPAGNRLKLIRAVNIPVCPDAYKFRSEGERLSFSLEFPPLAPGTEWFDIVEECSDNCFWIYGVTLDLRLNAELDEAFAADMPSPEEHALLFRKILEEVDSRNLGIEGLLYLNIINSESEVNDKIEAATWYRRFLSSGAPRLNLYIKYLNDKGIKY